MTLKSSIQILMLLMCLLALTFGINFGFSYILAMAPLVFGLFFLCGTMRKTHQIATFLIIVCLFAFYMFRPLVLVSNPLLYKFARMNYLTESMQIEVLLFLSILNTVAVGIGYALFRFLIPGDTRSFSQSIRDINIKDQVFLLALAILALYILVSFVKYIGMASGPGLVRLFELVLFVKFAFALPVAVIVAHLCGVARRSDRQIKLGLICIAAYVLALFLQGSKSFLIELAFLFLIYVILFRVNIIIKPKNIFYISVISVFLIFSFPIVTAVRLVTSDYGPFNFGVAEVVERLAFMSDFTTDGNFLLYVLDLMTKRFNGYDGLIVAWNNLYLGGDYFFNIHVMIVNAVSALIPMMQSEYASFGQMISTIFYGFASEDEIIHGGALGHYGILWVFSGGSFSSFFLYFIGFLVFWGLVFRFGARLVGIPLVRTILFGVLTLAFALCVNSGNFDRNLQEVIMLMLQGAVLSIIWSPAPGHTRGIS